jgi:hypothetical protein
LYGHTSQIHDAYTRTPLSFEQTLKGIKNIVEAGFLCQVNIVIMKNNYHSLEAIADMVADLGVSRIKFGNLVGIKACAPHAVRLSEVKPYLCDAIVRAEDRGLYVTVEKTPVCVAGRRIDLMSTEQKVFGGKTAYDDNGECKRCLVRRWCDGLDQDYVELFGYDGIAAIHNLPRSVLRPKAVLPDLLKMHCVEIGDDEPTGTDATELLELLLEVQNQHGCLAIIPNRYLTEIGGGAVRAAN